MKIVIILLVILSAACSSLKHPRQPRGYKKDFSIQGYFNEDSLLDELVIYNNKISLKGTIFDTCISPKCRLYLGGKNRTHHLFFESDSLFPWAWYTGRSDNMFDTLYILKNKLIWRTCVAPRYSNDYRLEQFTFDYSELLCDFTLINYSALVYASPEDDEGFTFELNQEELAGAYKSRFKIDEWDLFSPQCVIINENNLAKWNTLSDQFFKSELFYKARMIQEMIVYYLPAEFDSYRKIADVYWEEGNFEKAKEQYQRFLLIANGRPVPGYVNERMQAK